MPEVEPNAPYADDLALIRDAGAEAGRIAMSYFRGERALDIQWKHGNSPVTEADFAVDAFLKDALLGARPEYGWMSEESRDDMKHDRMQAARTFIVDPIDGTRAFMDGRQTWCISIGIVEGNKAVAGVLDCPALGETYWATRSGGAFADGRKMVLEAGKAPDPLVIGGAKSLAEKLAALSGMPVVHHPHVPSLAYRIAMVADGRLSGTFIRPNAHDWDIAAADIILREAGGSILDGTGNRVRLNGDISRKPFMVAAGSGLGQTMLSVVGPDTFG